MGDHRPTQLVCGAVRVCLCLSRKRMTSNSGSAKSKRRPDREDTVSLDRPQRGVFVPALTPFKQDLAVDEARFVEHCRWLLAEGANGLAVFGTTSEANSLSHDERRHLLDRVIGSGIAPRALMPGTGCCAIPDTVALTRHAVERGVLGVLL